MMILAFKAPNPDQKTTTGINQQEENNLSSNDFAVPMKRKESKKNMLIAETN